MRALKPDAALASLRDLWLYSSPPLAIWGLPIGQENRLRLTWQKRLAENGKFSRTANGSKQWEQFKKLRRFYGEATFGTALSTTDKRSRARLFFDDWQLFFALTRRIRNGQIKILETDAANYVRVLGPILEALSNENDEFFSDLAIAIRFEKNRSTANTFLARYSLLMVGGQPDLTFGEIQKILHWSPHDLRKKIRELRKKYGEWAVPLKRGRPGRPARGKNRAIRKIGG
jgi:hypothetical protein